MPSFFATCRAVSSSLRARKHRVVVNRLRPAGELSFGLGGGDTFNLPLQHHLTLELSDAADHRHHQPAGCGCGIEFEVENPHCRALSLDALDDLPRSGTDRANLSSFVTMSVSPGRR